jgi:putative MFS transporter
LLVKGPLGWRTVYFVGAVPLVLLAFARRSMRETRRFEELTREREASPERARDDGLFAIWRGPRRVRVVQVALVWALCYVCTQNTVTFWKEFAMAERGLTDGDVGLAVSIAAVGSLPLAFLAGKLLDRIGRKPGAAIIFVAASLGTLGAYTLSSRAPLTASLILAIFGATAVLTVLNAFTAELFPTEERASAFAWCNNLLGRVGYVLSPMVVGWAAGRLGWSVAVGGTALFPIAALALVYAWFPETRGKDLEAIAER